MNKKIDLSMYKTSFKGVLKDKKPEKKQIETKKAKPKKTKALPIQKPKKNPEKLGEKKLGRPTIYSKPVEKQVSVKFTREEYEILRKQADGIPLANYVRRMVREKLKLK